MHKYYVMYRDWQLGLVFCYLIFVNKIGGATTCQIPSAEYRHDGFRSRFNLFDTRHSDAVNGREACGVCTWPNPPWPRARRLNPSVYQPTNPNDTTMQKSGRNASSHISRGTRSPPTM